MFLLESFYSHAGFDIERGMTMARKPAEQRISRRIPVGTPAILKFEEQELTGYVEVLNLNGMYVAANRFPTLGGFVDMILTLPGNPRRFRVRASESRMRSRSLSAGSSPRSMPRCRV